MFFDEPIIHKYERPKYKSLKYIARENRASFSAIYTLGNCK